MDKKRIPADLLKDGGDAFKKLIAARKEWWKKQWKV